MNLTQAITRAIQMPGRNIRSRCPIHGGSSASLSLRQVNGRLLVNCFAGCDGEDVLREINGLGLDLPSTEYQAVEPVSFDARKAEACSRLWHASSPVTTLSIVDTYLRSRGITLPSFPSSLRCSARTYCRVDNGTIDYLPAMVARVDSPEGEIVTVHRTYLAPGGSGKAPLQEPKRIMPCSVVGATKGAAIRLFEPGQVMGVAEGIETALASHVMSGHSVWAAISAGGLESIILPQVAREVIIFADSDLNGRGEQAAYVLRRRLRAEGRSVEIRIPAEQGKDWNDVLLEEVRRKCE